MATNSLGRLTLDLVVQLGSFQDGFTKAERTVKNTTDNMKQSVKSFGSQIQDTLGNTQIGSLIGDISSKMSSLRGGIALAAAGLAGMAIGGVVVATGTLATMAVELAKTNMQLMQFASLANTSISSFQGLSGAAQLFGMSQEKTADMLKDFNEKIGEFASVGGGEAKDFFEQIAVKTEKGAEGAKKLAAEMSKMDGVAALQTYVDKLEEAGLNQQQMSYYLESMGSDLTALAPILVDGGALWKEYQAAMEEAGIMTSAEAIEQSKILAAQTGALTLQYEGLKSNLAQAVMPALSGVISYFTDGSVKGNQFGGVIDLVGKTAKVVAVTIVGLSAAISVVGQTIRGVMDLIGNLGKTIVDFWNAPTLALKGQALWQGFLNNGNILNATVESQVETLRDAYKSGSNIMNSQIGDMNGLAKAQYNISEAQSQYNASQKQGLITGIAQNKALNEQTDAQKKLTEQQKASAAAAKKLADERAELNKMVGASALTGLRITGQRAINGGNVRAYTASFAKLVQSQMGKDLGYFTAFNDKYHKGTTSRHATGQAFDFTIANSKKSAQTEAQLKQMAKAYGYVIKVRDEYLYPSERSTGPHMHVSVLGFNGTKEMQQNAAAEVDLVRKATDEADKIREESLKRQALVVLKYADEDTRMQLEHSAEIQQINDAFGVGSDQAKKYISIQEEKFAQEKRLYQLRDAQIFNDSQWAFQTDIQRITSKYEFERAQIAATYEYDEMMKGALTNASYKSQDLENDNARHGAWMEYQGAIGIDTVAEEEQTRRNEAIRAALDWQLITQEEYQQKMLESERAFHAAKASLALGYGEQIVGSTAETFGMLFGKQSTAYRAMFAMQKGFAIAQSVIAIQQGIANAMALPFPENLAAAATVAGETASIVSNIQAIAMPTGMAHNGIDNIPKEGTWLLDGGERVLNPQQNKDLTNYLANQGNGGGGGIKVIINNHGNDKVEASRDSDGNLLLTIKQMVDGAVDSGIQRNLKQGYPLRNAIDGRR